jgi:G3E family GTPase
VTAVDAVNGEGTLDRHIEAVKQAAMADRIVLTKSDIAPPEAVVSLRARLKMLNPGAVVLDAAKGEATAAMLLNAGLYDAARKTADVKKWLAEAAVEEAEHAHHHHDHAHAHDHDHDHDDKIRTFSLVSEQPISASTLEMFLDFLRATQGPKLLRLKGIVRLAEEPEQPLVIHMVQHIVHPPARLPAWPDDDRRSRLVCVTHDLDPAIVRRLFDAFRGVPRADTPDRAALTDNPLSLHR